MNALIVLPLGLVLEIDGYGIAPNIDRWLVGER